MGNKASQEKIGFYTPTISPSTDSKVIPPITPFSMVTPNVNEVDEKVTTAIMTAKSPDISELEDGDTTQFFRPTFNNDISDMLSEIATEIDGDYQAKHGPTLQLLDGISSINSENFTPIPISPAPSNSKYAKANENKRRGSYKKKKKYAHIKLDFVKPDHYVHKISSVFTYHKQLGCGASCRVLLVNENKDENELYALKEMHISDDLNRLLFATEYKILQILAGHKNIISYHSSYIDKNCYYLSTSYCSGGTMLDRIIKQGHFNEKQCAEFIKEVLIGIKYMHDNKIVHRDIKCENLIFDKPGKDGIVKIIDFGNSEIINNPKEIDKILIGSLHYLPPEMLSTKSRIKEELYKGDMWAIGVVCFILVSGKVPFYGNNQSETLESIRRGVFAWPENVELSDSCRDFISSLLNTDVAARSTANEALKHPWISQKGKATNTAFGDSHLNQIQLFSTANKLQKILINAILSEMDKTEKKVLLTALRDLDMNGNGRINENDIINYILMHGDINEKQSNAKTKAKKFMTHVRNLSSYGVNSVIADNKFGDNPSQSDIMHISLHEIDIEGILDEIDEEEAKSPDPQDIDEEDALAELKKEFQMDKMGKTECNLSATVSAKSATTASAVQDRFDMVHDSDTDDDKLDTISGDEEEEEDDAFDIEAVERHKLNFYNFSSAQSIESLDDEFDGKLSSHSSFGRRSPGDILPKAPPKVTTKISVERFSCIMSYADKEYDVQELVQKLQPTNSGNIPLKHINMFNGPLHSKRSNNKMMHDMIVSGLNSVQISSDEEDDEMNEDYVMLEDEDCIE